MEKVIALLPWDITVRRARTRKQAHELLERKDADEAIRALTETEAYYAVKELGVDGAIPFLAVLEPQQITALFDLDVWHDQRAEISDLLIWLVAFKEASPAQLSRAVRAIDPELFALMLRRRLWIAVRPSEDDPDASAPDWLANPPDEILPLVETPDQRFVIAARHDDPDSGDHPTPIDEEERKAILDLVDVLYREEEYEPIVEALRLAESDLASSLEEAAQRFRTGRLEDLGFPSLERAVEVYAPIDPRELLGASNVHAGHADFMLPAIHAQQISQGLFQEVLRSIESPEIVRRIEGELVALTNAVLVAERVEPGDLEQLREVLDRVRAYLELALAWNADAGRVLEIGRQRLESHPVRTLFRAGYGITVELARRASKIEKSGAFAIRSGQTLALLPDADRAVLEALRLPRPLLSRVLDDAAKTADEPRPFRTMRDVELAKGALDDLEALASFALEQQLSKRNAELSGALDPPEPMERDVDMLLVTMAAVSILGRGFHLEPLGAEDLATLCRLLAPPPAVLSTAAPANPARPSPQEGRGSAKLECGRFPTELVDRALEQSRVRLTRLLAEEPRGSRREEGREPVGLPIERRMRRGLAALEETLSPLVGASEIDPRYVGVVVRRVG
jgi:uncharacterized protein DUF6178